MKYGIKIHSGGIKKRVVGQVDTYRKASIFWTRNPKLTNPMKDKRVWVQVAKNFTPHIKLSQEEVQQELFDFEETINVKASEIGTGEHQISATNTTIQTRIKPATAPKTTKLRSDKSIRI